MDVWLSLMPLFEGSWEKYRETFRFSIAALFSLDISRWRRASSFRRLAVGTGIPLAVGMRLKIQRPISTKKVARMLRFRRAMIQRIRRIFRGETMRTVVLGGEFGTIASSLIPPVVLVLALDTIVFGVASAPGLMNAYIAESRRATGLRDMEFDSLYGQDLVDPEDDEYEPSEQGEDRDEKITLWPCDFNPRSGLDHATQLWLLQAPPVIATSMLRIESQLLLAMPVSAGIWMELTIKEQSYLQDEAEVEKNEEEEEKEGNLIEHGKEEEKDEMINDAQC
ncbi:hypothetical protein L228DRAFT_242010 [Xylona heveae TC161]|uniref:Uncharacterized protein n=1 Tax=Xylona heveae (strain CBS 132557 / TC161) TaxID=1328760 RepID=A0A164ZDP3_XYLHT|nr:hypothetical protein L228DRAFT_242010 [Xylona heveae TC161]KZF18972.1 hypothetical protein L228DRAFT_242010 [Xylona heveae TC161]